MFLTLGTCRGHLSFSSSSCLLDGLPFLFQVPLNLPRSTPHPSCRRNWEPGRLSSPFPWCPAHVPLPVYLTCAGSTSQINLLWDYGRFWLFRGPAILCGVLPIVDVEGLSCFVTVNLMSPAVNTKQTRKETDAWNVWMETTVFSDGEGGGPRGSNMALTRPHGQPQRCHAHGRLWRKSVVKTIS